MRRVNDDYCDVHSVRLTRVEMSTVPSRNSVVGVRERRGPGAAQRITTVGHDPLRRMVHRSMNV